MAHAATLDPFDPASIRVDPRPARWTWPPSPAAASALAAGAACAFAFVAFFARGLTDAGLASSSVAFYRYALTAVITAPFLALGRAKRRATTWAMASGLGMGLGWIAYVEAIRTIEVTTVGVIYMTYPLFTLGAAWLLFGLRPAGRAVLAGMLIAAAAICALSPAATGIGDPVTVLVAFLAPLTFGTAIAVLAERLDTLDPLERVAGASLGAVIGLLPLLVSLPVSAVVPASGGGWLLVIGIGIGTSLLPMTVYAMAAPIAGAARAATAGACELPTVFLIGWLLLGEQLSPLHLVALALIIMAIAISPSRPVPALRPTRSSADTGRGVGVSQPVAREHHLPQLEVTSPETAR